MKSVVPRAAYLKAAADRIASEPIISRFTLGNYYVAKLSLTSGDALILTGFDLDGRILCEKTVRGKLMNSPRAARERIGEFALRGCPFFAAGRKADGSSEKTRREASDECESIFKILFENGSVLKEYVMVNGFDFTLMSGKSKAGFPLKDKP